MSCDLKQSIRIAAGEIGFDLVGVASPVIDDRFKQAFVDTVDMCGRGRPAYLARNVEKRLDPKLLVPTVRSIICLAVGYYQPHPECNRLGKVAMYAWGADYHRVVKGMVVRLAGEIEKRIGRKIAYRVFVDTAPVLEKALAQQAGLGWIGGNGCLINRRLGSYLFLGELFVDLELDPDEPEKYHCGTFRRCIERCPTGAIVGPGRIDVERCISYLTIEHHGDIPNRLARKFEGWIFGCDICQQVCPFNRFAEVTRITEFRDRWLGPQIDPGSVLDWTEQEYRDRTARSAGARAGLDQWHRNARLLLGG